MNKTLLFIFFLLYCPCLLFSQEEKGIIDLNNKEQIHILQKKNGERYIGRILAISKKVILFQPNGVSDSTRISIRRKSVKLIQSHIPYDNNNGELRPEFLKIKEAHPQIDLDPYLDFTNRTQQVKLIYKGRKYEGQIWQLNRKGVELKTSNQFIYFKYKFISKIEAIKLDLVNSKEERNYFQADTLPKPTIPPSNYIKVDEGFNIKQENQIHIIFTKRGDQLTGHVDSLNEKTIFFTMNEQSVFALDREDIEKIEVHFKGYIRKMDYKDEPVYRKIKVFEGEDYILAQNRLYASPTGFGIKKGETEYRGILAFINNFDYGVSDNFSIGLGFYPLIGANVINARVNLSTDLGQFFHVSGNAQFFYNFGGIGNPRGDYGYVLGGAMSIGSPKFFLNIGYNRWRAGVETRTNFGFRDDGRKTDMVSFGGSFKIKSSFRGWIDIMIHRDATRGEEIFFSNYDGFTHITFGGSWFNRLNKVDFGFFVQPGVENSLTNGFIAFPLGSFTRRF